MSPHTPALATADLLARVVAARDLDQASFTPPTWLLHGYVGPGKVTLLTSQWKSGKTTRVSLLLARMQQGGQLVGLPVAGGKAFVISVVTPQGFRCHFPSRTVRRNPPKTAARSHLESPPVAAIRGGGRRRSANRMGSPSWVRAVTV
jgi:hypothetical protein